MSELSAYGRTGWLVGWELKLNSNQLPVAELVQCFCCCFIQTQCLNESMVSKALAFSSIGQRSGCLFCYSFIIEKELRLQRKMSPAYKRLPHIKHQLKSNWLKWNRNQFWFFNQSIVRAGENELVLQQQQQQQRHVNKAVLITCIHFKRLRNEFFDKQLLGWARARAHFVSIVFLFFVILNSMQFEVRHRMQLEETHNDLFINSEIRNVIRLKINPCFVVVDDDDDDDDDQNDDDCNGDNGASFWR